VLDRFIQQALLQVLQPRIDPSFSEHSYGFRPERRARDHPPFREIDAEAFDVADRHPERVYGGAEPIAARS